MSICFWNYKYTCPYLQSYTHAYAYACETWVYITCIYRSSLSLTYYLSLYLFFILSFTLSLFPRMWVLQGSFESWTTSKRNWCGDNLIPLFTYHVHNYPAVRAAPPLATEVSTHCSSEATCERGRWGGSSFLLYYITKGEEITQAVICLQCHKRRIRLLKNLCI